MLSVIFAVSYQSLHAFSHHHSEISDCCQNNKEQKKSFKQTISEKEDCIICDFKFASFLSPEIFTYTFFSPFKISPYSFSIKEATCFFCGSLFAHRGPPVPVHFN
ncbi:hypothetical protein NHF50_05785 [Flavobacterium sp. NRK F10]|uniref:hypothetical protein n=1 Tax=Flavobacterium sp. NRK F10 TaxID=2954931 RepID=UPI002090CCEC|nr:hypothetical protein [Flavobacterium sp. NRK F10]MCO6174549.1 hypothetical protein [Flavobacterium sp. NRK F10]